MADISSITLPNGSIYDLKDSYARGKLEPIIEKTYEGVIGTANNATGASFWYGFITPHNWNEPWHIRYEEVITMSGQPLNGSYTGWVELYGIGETRQTYAIWNNYKTSSYRAIYYHPQAFAKTEAVATEYGHLFGVALQSSYAPTNSTYARKIQLKVTAADNCTVEVGESLLPYSTWNSTNWGSVSNLDATNNGLRESGDDNSTDRFCMGSATFKADSTMYGGQLILSEDGQNFFSIQTKARAVSVSNVCTTRGFRPEHIYYYSSGTTVAANASTATWTVFRYIPFDLRYSANVTSFTTQKNAYLVMTYNADDGLFYLDTTKWITQDLPTEADGKYYLRLAYMYSTTSGYMYEDQVIYYYDAIEGRIKSTNAQTISSDIKANTEKLSSLSADVEANKTKLSKLPNSLRIYENMDVHGVYHIKSNDDVDFSIISESFEIYSLSDLSLTQDGITANVNLTTGQAFWLVSSLRQGKLPNDIALSYIDAETMYGAYGVTSSIEVSLATGTLTLYLPVTTSLTEVATTYDCKAVFNLATLINNPVGTLTGTVSGSGSDVTVTPTTTTVNTVVRTGTLPELNMSVSNKLLTIGFSQGTLPTTASRDVVTGIYVNGDEVANGTY